MEHVFHAEPLHSSTRHARPRAFCFPPPPANGPEDNLLQVWHNRFLLCDPRSSPRSLVRPGPDQERQSAANPVENADVVVPTIAVSGGHRIVLLVPSRGAKMHWPQCLARLVLQVKHPRSAPGEEALGSTPITIAHLFRLTPSVPCTSGLPRPRTECRALTLRDRRPRSRRKRHSVTAGRDRGTLRAARRRGARHRSRPGE